MPSCFIQEEAEAKGGVVAFRGDPGCHWQSCEKNPGSPRHSAEGIPWNDLYRPKVSYTWWRMLLMDVIQWREGGRNSSPVNVSYGRSENHSKTKGQDVGPSDSA